MDNKFTDKIRQWLETPAADRDYQAGALLLLQLSGNKIMYRNLMMDPKRKADFIEYQIQKYYNFRVKSLTRQQVRRMEQQVEEIVEKNISRAVQADKLPHKGKREDHDKLPDDIKAMYVENLSLLHKMRDLHLKLRSLSLDNAPCPDSERFPFLKELIAIDKKLHKNWETYDRYVIGAGKKERVKGKTTTRATHKKKTRTS